MQTNRVSIGPVLLACFGSIFIGSSGIFIRLSDLGPITTGFYRTLFALPFLALWMRWEQQKGLIQHIFPKRDYLGLLGAGIFFALDLTLWNWSIDHTTIVNSTLFNNTAAFFVPFFMWIVFRQKQSLRFLLTATVCFLGCICLVGDSISVNLTYVWGDVVALVSGTMVALYLIALRRIREDISTGFLMFWTGLLALLFLGGFALLSGESFWPLTWKDIISISGQALVVHVLGQSLLAYSLGKIPANYVALILFLAPVTAGVLGWAFYDETLGFLKIVGMLLIVVSIMSLKRNT